MGNKKRFEAICKDIKSIKIQGARNIARAALQAYSLEPTKQAKAKLLSLRPTEPMLANVLDKADKVPLDTLLGHFDKAQDAINKNVFKIIKPKERIFTHCHSSNVINSLVYAKKHGKDFEVYNTETRPLYQGRKTASELEKAGIKVTMFIDSAAAFAIEKESKADSLYANLILLGADAITNQGIINKIGSKIIAEIAKNSKIPVYIVADSWKYTNKKTPIESRKLNEIWDDAPRHIKIKNPAFEFVGKKYIKGIVSELGVLPFEGFIEKASKEFTVF
jgi:ribose 1,5-bisphosphate isomerase